MIVGAVSLPPELYSAIMDFVDVPELVAISHVCAPLRAAAHAHPLFWRDINLRATSPSALAFFEARLARNTAKVGISTFIHLDRATNTSTDATSTIVLLLVQRNVFRTARLTLKLSADSWEAGGAVCILESAAMLRYLSLECIDGLGFHRIPRSVEASIQTQLLSGFAPNLRTLEIINMSLLDPIGNTDACPAPAFQRVESLRYEVTARVDLKRIIALFPSLRHLSLYAITCEADGRNLPSITLPLASIHVILRDGGYAEFFAAFHDLSTVSHLSFSFSPSDTATATQAALQTLPAGPLTLALALCDSPRIFARGESRSFTFSAGGLSRTVVMDPWDLRFEASRTRARDAFFPIATRARIVSLRLADEHEFLLPFVQELPACETVEILHAPGSGLQMMGGETLQFPALRTVRLSVFGDVRVQLAAETVCDIISPVIGQRARTMDIVLDGIIVMGNLSAAMNKRSWTRSESTSQRVVE